MVEIARKLKEKKDTMINKVILKIRAFTLLEIMISLILSFFVVGILYLMFYMMENQFRNEYKKQLSNLMLLKSEIEMDFFYADTLTIEQNQLVVFQKGEIVKYFFFDDAILKATDLRKDTLYKGVCSASFNRFEKSDWINSLTLNFSTEKEDIRISFNKIYTPCQKLRNKEVRFEY